MPAPAPRTRDLVLGAAAVLVTAQLALRAWALYPSWFYLDDLRLLADADRGRSAAQLLEPYDSQLMPMGRAIAWLVASDGASWWLAATLTLAVQAAAGAACVWMLVTLCGARWGIIAPLTLYLSTAVTLPATMWWAASLNALPLQVAFFCSVACWVRYLRSRGVGWLVLTVVAVALGLSAYVKALVLLPLLVLLAGAYFADGGLLTRARTVVTRLPAALGVLAVLGAGFLGYYLTQVPQLATGGSVRQAAAPLADRMLGTALPTGLLGGPWRWDDQIAPNGLADPPAWAVRLAWLTIALAAAYWVLRRSRTGRAWLLLGSSAVASFALLLVTRAPVVGPLAGLEYRYLSDVAGAWVLTLALVTMPMVGSGQGSAPRGEPLLRVGLDRRAAIAAVTAVAVSGIISSVTYARLWHSHNPAQDYVGNAASGLGDAGPVDVADLTVPDRVMPGYLHPENRLSRLLPVFVPDARFPDISDDLVVLDDDGVPWRAGIESRTESDPGPDGECGWRVGPTGRSIPLPSRTIDYEWWVRVGYLAAREDTVRVTLAGTTLEAPIRRGLHGLFVRVHGPISTVRISGVRPGNTVCVDRVEVGDPVPGGPL